MTATSYPTQQLLDTPVVERLRARAFNRSVAQLAYEDAVENHHLVRAELIDDAVEGLGGLSQADLLSELRQHGLLWSVIAEAVGVSDTAVRKWRRGQSIEPVHHRRLRRFVALGQLYREYALPVRQTDFAEWVDTRIVASFSATPLHVIKMTRDGDTGNLQPLLDWMLQQPGGQSSEELLDRYLSTAWRQEAQEEQRFRIVTNAAGERVLLIDG